MKLLFKQRFFSWMDSYDIYNEEGEVLFTVEGRLAFGHCLDILDGSGTRVGRVREEIFTFLPRFRLYLGEEFLGEIRKDFTFFRPKFSVDCNGWEINGDFFEWEYEILSPSGQNIARISKELLNWTDTYVLDIAHTNDALAVLMVALAIDAAKCSSQ